MNTDNAEWVREIRRYGNVTKGHLLEFAIQILEVDIRWMTQVSLA